MGKKSTMGRESQIDSRRLSSLAHQKVQELVALLAEEEFGDDGRPPIDTTFSTIEEKAITAGVHAPSYQIGAKLLDVVGEINIAGRQLNKLAVKIGAELTSARDA